MIFFDFLLGLLFMVAVGFALIALDVLQRRWSVITWIFGFLTLLVFAVGAMALGSNLREMFLQ